MELPSFYRKDLVKKFPNNFSFIGLQNHFTSEYQKVVGTSPPKLVVKHLAQTFSTVWKKVKNKLIFSEPLAQQSTPANQTKNSSVILQKTRKAFQNLTKRGKRCRRASTRWAWMGHEQDQTEAAWLFPLRPEKKGQSSMHNIFLN